MDLRVFQQYLHLLQDQILNHLATICNLSFSTGVFPAILKTAKVIPIRKKNSKLEVSNYRLISLLCNIDKFFEKLMHRRLIEFLEGKKFSITDSLGLENFLNKPYHLNFARKHTEALDDGQFACGVFIDREEHLTL